MAAKPGSSGGLALLAGLGPYRRRSSVVVGVDLGEQTVASIHEEYSHDCEPAWGASAHTAAAGEERVVARRFDLLSGEMEVVALAAAAGGACVGSTPVTRTYGGRALPMGRRLGTL